MRARRCRSRSVPAWPDEHPEEFEQLLRDRLDYPTPPECWRAQYDACARFVAERRPVEKIAAPTLVVHGEPTGSCRTPTASSSPVASPAPASSSFDGAGHLLFLEEPERFNDLVEAFLE